MKRMLSILCAVLLALTLAACEGKESPSSRSEREPSQGGGKVISGGGSAGSGSEAGSEAAPQGQPDQPYSEASEGPLAIATDFAVNFYWAFASPEELDPTRFCLLKIYYEDPAATDEQGILWVSPERLREEVLSRFDVADYQFQSPEQWNVYPRYVEEKGAIAFYPAGGNSNYAVKLVGQEAQGEYYDYIFDVYDNFITDGHEEMTLETTLRYRFRVSEDDSGAPILRAVSATEVTQESAPAQGGGDTGAESLTQEEQRDYFDQYIEPYYIVGLMYNTWSDPEEIEVERYMKFYIYNESSDYWSENPGNGTHSIPADVVEDYITSYFEVEPGYLRTAQYYDAGNNRYDRMVNEGIGGGPGVTIERIEKDGNLWKFVCRNISDNLLSVTIRMMDDGTFRYIAGEGLDL